MDAAGVGCMALHEREGGKGVDGKLTSLGNSNGVAFVVVHVEDEARGRIVR